MTRAEPGSRGLEPVLLWETRMPLMVHAMRRAELPENGVLPFEVAGGRYLVADIDGEVTAYAVVGPLARDLDRAAVAEGRLRCPRHGWPIEPERGGCGAADRCRYEPLAVEADGEEVGSRCRVRDPASGSSQRQECQAPGLASRETRRGCRWRWRCPSARHRTRSWRSRPGTGST